MVVIPGLLNAYNDVKMLEHAKNMVRWMYTATMRDGPIEGWRSRLETENIIEIIRTGRQTILIHPYGEKGCK